MTFVRSSCSASLNKSEVDHLSSKLDEKKSGLIHYADTYQPLRRMEEHQYHLDRQQEVAPRITLPTSPIGESQPYVVEEYPQVTHEMDGYERAYVLG